MTTQADIRLNIKTGALRKLGVLAATETASAADDQLVETALKQLIDSLLADGDVHFDNLTIPEDASHGLIALLADAVGDGFGLDNGRAARIRSQADQERRALRTRIPAVTSADVTFGDF